MRLELMNLTERTNGALLIPFVTNPQDMETACAIWEEMSFVQTMSLSFF